MPDLSSAAREAAEQEADARDLVMQAAAPFIAGFTECASRLPSEEELAVELEKHKLIHVSVSCEAAFCRCDSSTKARTDKNLEWFEAHRAQAVLALIGEKMKQQPGLHVTPT